MAMDKDRELLTVEEEQARIFLLDLSVIMWGVFRLHRRIALAVLLGVLFFALHPHPPDLYRWLVAGIAVCTLLCWYLPLRGSSVVLTSAPIDLSGRLIKVSPQISVQYVDRVLWGRYRRVLWCWLIVVYLIPFVVAILGMRVNLENISTPYYLYILIALSTGLSIPALFPRHMTGFNIDIDFIITDYRIVLSYSIWTSFLLYNTLSIMLN